MAPLEGVPVPVMSASASTSCGSFPPRLALAFRRFRLRHSLAARAHWPRTRRRRSQRRWRTLPRNDMYTCALLSLPSLRCVAVSNCPALSRNRKKRCDVKRSEDPPCGAEAPKAPFFWPGSPRKMASLLQSRARAEQSAALSCHHWYRFSEIPKISTSRPQRAELQRGEKERERESWMLALFCKKKEAHGTAAGKTHTQGHPAQGLRRPSLPSLGSQQIVLEHTIKMPQAARWHNGCFPVP